MYGTLAFMRTLPGRRTDLVEALMLGRGYRGNYMALSHGLVSGWISTFVYELDRDPDEAAMLVAFDSRKSYRENAETTEQHARYETYRAALNHEPEWHDGEITPFLSFPESEGGESLYGTVGRFQLKPGAEPALDEYLSRWRGERPIEAVPGGIGSWLLRPDEAPELAYVAVLFESKRHYVENAEDPATDRQYKRFRRWLSQDPEWFDGRVRAFQRF
jgi:hypothetical protein